MATRDDAPYGATSGPADNWVRAMVPWGCCCCCRRDASSLARRRAMDGRSCLDGRPRVGCSAVEGGGAPTPHARHIIIVVVAIIVTIVVTSTIAIIIIVIIVAIVTIIIIVVVVRPLPHSSCAPATPHLSLLLFFVMPSSFMPVSSSMPSFFDSVVPFVDAASFLFDSSFVSMRRRFQVQWQLATTMDVDCHPWMDWVHGGLQYVFVSPATTILTPIVTNRRADVTLFRRPSVPPPGG
jgi:hypothetical protein